MAEPQVQYAKTSDGVNIAFWTLGEGMPLVEMSTPPDSHIQLEWQTPELRSWFERLAEKWNLVRYDGRGFGLSERDVTDFSLDARLLDLEAVVNRLELETFALYAAMYAGPVAIAYAAQHPNRVSHLILWHAWARTQDTASPQLRALGRLLDTDWETYTETTAHALLGWSQPEEARRTAARYREGATQEAWQAAIRATRGVDVSGLLSHVSVPTLVLQRRQAGFPQAGVAQGLASRIPDARLALMEGTSPSAHLEDMDSVLAVLGEFLGEGEEAATEPPETGAFRTILFTDMAGSTSLTQRLGDAAAQELLRTHNRIVRDALKAHSGTETKHTGDGIMASFTSASAALEAAVAIQKALAVHNEGNPESTIRVRIGLNAGEPVAEDEDLFGTAVQLAARVCDKAEAGQILVSNVVQELAAGKGFDFGDQGEASLKGFEKPVRLHEVRWHD